MMKKCCKFMILFFISLFFVVPSVNAIEVKEEQILYNSYVIGTYLYTTDENDIYNTSDLDTVYDENAGLFTQEIMLASTTIEKNTYDEMLIYYKDFWDEWTNALSGEVIMIDGAFEITHVNGICVDPSCKGETRDVTLDFNDGTPYNDPSESVTYTEAYEAVFNEPVKPTRLGYEFVCWTLDDKCYDFSSTLTEDITLVASWSVREYTVTYHNTVGVAGDVSVKTCNFENQNKLCSYIPYSDSDNGGAFASTPDGYSFVGWSLAPSGEKVYRDDSIVEIYGEDTSIDLYSIFNSGTYNIYYALNGGTFDAAVNPVTVYDPSDLEYDLYTPSRVGYTFAGWEVTEGNADINDDSFEITILGNITLEATWNANTYDVVYDNNENEIILNNQSCTYDKNCGLDLSKIPVAAGKRISSITANVGNENYAVGSTVKNLTTSDNAKIKVNVSFEDITYNISYDLNGGVANGNYVNEIKYGETIVVNEPTKVGYTFKGWTNSDSLEVNGTSVKLVAEGNGNLVANWEANTYDVVYFDSASNSNVKLNEETCVYDSYCTLNTDLINLPEGKELDRIEVLINGNSTIIGDTVFNLSSSGNDVVVTPYYKDIQYSIKYNGIDGILSIDGIDDGDNTPYFDGVAVSSIALGETKELVLPNRYGYVLIEWRVDDTDAVEIENVKIPDPQNSMDGIIIATKITLKKPQDVVLTPYMEGTRYTVSYDLNGGILDDTDAILEDLLCKYGGCTIYDSYIPSRDGYTFEGWEYKGRLYQAGDSLAIADDTDVLLTAKWINKEKKTINYDLDGGTFVGNPIVTYIAGDTYELSVPVREGYAFDGWYDEEDNLITSVNGLAEDINIKAKWNVNTYTIVLYKDNEGNEVLKEIECTYDESCAIGDNSNEFGTQNFIGWNTNPGQTNIFYGDNIEVAKLTNVNEDKFALYPVFGNVTTYSVNYYLNDGEYVAADNVLYSVNEGSTLVLPEVTKYGYEIEKWQMVYGPNVEDVLANDEGNFEVIIDKDVYFFAVWKERSEYTVSLDYTSVNDTYGVDYENYEISCNLEEACIVEDNYGLEDYNAYWMIEGDDTKYYVGDELPVTWDLAYQNNFNIEIVVEYERINN